MRLPWEMSWDLFWFRMFALSSDRWFDIVIELTLTYAPARLFDNDNDKFPTLP